LVDTFQGALVIMVVLLPGALSTWGFEREVGSWGVGLADRLLRFVAWSAALHALAAPITLWAWKRFVHSGRLLRGDLPWGLWPVVLAYIAVPFALGLLLGRGTRRRWPWVRTLIGGHPSPTAWEHLFGHDPQGTIRIRLKSGSYVAGLYVYLDEAHKSYASAYPHSPMDLWLVKGVPVDPSTGEFVPGGQALDAGLLVRYDEIETLEFIPNPD
jgi:hypothetical protein